MRRPIFYGWVVVAVTAVVVTLTAGIRSAPGAFIPTMAQEPGWSTGSVSFAAASGFMLYGLAGPLSGWLMGRLGVRSVVVLSLATTGGALIVTAGVREIWQLSLFFGLVAGLGTGLVASVLGPTVATRWFVKDRGLVTGIFGASSRAGQLIFFPVLTVLAVGAGWRFGVLVLAALALALRDPRKLLLTYYAFRGVSLLYLPFIHDTASIAAFAVLFGLDYIATVPPTVALVADRFGRHNVGVVYGWVFAAHMFGAGIAAWAAGIVRDSVGDYASAFVAAGFIAILAAFASLGIRRPRPSAPVVAPTPPALA